MRIAWQNLLDSATLTAGSQITTLPVENLQSPHLATRWHTETGVTASYVLIDLGSALAVDVLAVLGSNLTAGATWRVRASTSDATAVSGDLYDNGAGSPLDPVDAGVDGNYGAIYLALASTVTARYWRIDLIDAAVADNLQVGRVFIGPAWQPTSGMLYGWAMTYADDTRRTRSLGGQTHVDVGPRYRRLQFGLSFMNEAEMYGNAFELARAAGLNGDVLVMPQDAGNYQSQQCVHGLLAQAAPLVHETHNVYRMRYVIEERL